VSKLSDVHAEVTANAGYAEKRGGEFIYAGDEGYAESRPEAMFEGVNCNDGRIASIVHAPVPSTAPLREAIHSIARILGRAGLVIRSFHRHQLTAIAQAGLIFSNLSIHLLLELNYVQGTFGVLE
jgi:hypothetical protein